MSTYPGVWNVIPDLKNLKVLGDPLREHGQDIGVGYCGAVPHKEGAEMGGRTESDMKWNTPNQPQLTPHSSP